MAADLWGIKGVDTFSDILWVNLLLALRILRGVLIDLGSNVSFNSD